MGLDGCHVGLLAVWLACVDWEGGWLAATLVDQSDHWLVIPTDGCCWPADLPVSVGGGLMLSLGECATKNW